MKPTAIKRLWGLLAAASMVLTLVGCKGADGQNGTNGTNGTSGTPGASYAIDAATYTADEWGQLSLSATITRATTGTSPATGGQPSVDFKVVDAHNVPVKGLGFTTQTSTAAFAGYANMAFSIAKLVPATSSAPSRWVNYIVTNNPTASAPTTWVPTRPTTDNIGTLVDHGDGTYTYTFRRDISQTAAQLAAYTYTAPNVMADLDDVSYQPNQTHRITVFVGGIARGTGDTTLGDRSANTSNGANTGLRGVYIKYPANASIDFIPATGLVATAANEQRQIVDTAACFTCHTKFEFHGAGRQDTAYCVVCHNDQRKYGRADGSIVTGTASSTGKLRGHAEGDFPHFIHRIHMGEELSLKYTGTGASASNPKNLGYGSVDFNEVTYPQDHRNCVKCHTASTATPQGDNWFNKPSRFACGGCHDAIDWATGANHTGGIQVNDANCSTSGCHQAADIKAAHLPVVPPNANNIYKVPVGGNNNTNAAYVAAYVNNLPTGAHRITYDLASVTLNGSAKPVFRFRFLKNGTPVVFNTYSAGVVTEMMDGFVGSPSLYLAMSLPQDGMQTPSDWNATASTYLKNVWNGTAAGTGAGTMTGPDGSGYYTVTLTGVVIPTSATQMVGGIGYTYGLTATQPITQIDLTAYPYNKDVDGTTTVNRMGGLSVPPPNVWKVVSGTLPAGFAPQTARRTIVANAKCNDCHAVLGVFTTEAYHAGQRNDANTCEFCHNGGRVNSGWGVNTKDFVHAIHGASKRANKFSWEFYSTGAKYWNVTYPGVLNNCEACHVPGSYNFDNPASASDLTDLCWTTNATSPVVAGVAQPTAATLPVVVTGLEDQLSGPYYSPWIQPSTVYGAAFSFNAATGATTQADSRTLVSSPYVAACSACHDSTMAIAHMKTNGGTFYQTRASVMSGGKFAVQEQCFLCHSAGKLADVKTVHMNFQ